MGDTTSMRLSYSSVDTRFFICGARRSQYRLTAWSRVLEQLTRSQFVQKSPAFINVREILIFDVGERLMTWESVSWRGRASHDVGERLM